MGLVLDRWRSYLTTPKTIQFPRLELMGDDHAPKIVSGTGEVNLPSLTSFEFTLRGTPADVKYAIRQFKRQRENPYDALTRFRLIGTDSEGTEWSLGWTTPRYEVDAQGIWTFHGDLDSLMPHGSHGAEQSGAEIVYSISTNHPLARAMEQYAPANRDVSSFRHDHELEVLGAKVRFCYEKRARSLTVTATHSVALMPTYSENWLGEPLRIMFGQQMYPRLIARNLGNGRSLVFIGPSPASGQRPDGQRCGMETWLKEGNLPSGLSTFNCLRT